MYISEISIKRPVLATVINLIIVLTGIVAFFKLPVRGTPDVNPPVISIETNYFGASPSFIEKNVTTPIEKNIRTAKNIDYISSTSSSGKSEIVMVFKSDADIDDALNDVRSKVSDTMILLPPEITTPSVSKMDSDNWPSIWITATGDKYDPMVLSDIITQRVIPELEKIDSVSKCKIFSNNEYAINIELDPLKLFQHQITPFDIRAKIVAQSKDYPAGYIRSQSRDYVVKLEGTLNSAEEFGNIILDPINLIKLRDVADVSLKPLESDSIIRYNGSETIAIGIIRDSKSNIIDLSNEVIKTLPKIQKSLPEGLKLFTAYDSGVPVKASINSVYKTAAEALILVLIIVYLFLGNATSTIVPFIAIPISLIGTFGFMQFAGFSINLYSLLAMILAIGLVVDDAIVMLENIYHHIENGLTPIEASFKASKEIGFAIVAMTFTLAAVFLPIGFIEGFVGQLFIEFAWTLAFAVIISGFVALTLSPMLCSKILKKSEENNTPNFLKKFHSYLDYASNKYEQILKLSLLNLKIVSASALGSIFLLFACFYFVNKEFVPTEDNAFMMIMGEGPEGSSINSTLSAIIQTENIIKNIPEVEGYFFNAFSNQAYGFIPLKTWDKRKKSQREVVEMTNKLLSNIPSMTLFAINPGFMRGDSEKPVSFNLVTFDSFEYLAAISAQYENLMKKSKIFANVTRNLKTSVPTIQLDFDRDKAGLYGVLLDQAGITMQYLFAGSRVAQFSVGKEKYDVFMQLPKSERNNINDLSQIYVKTLTGQMVNLANIAEIKETVSVLSYSHYNTAASVGIGADVSSGYSISEAKEELEKIASSIIDKSKISIEYQGDIKRMAESNSNMLYTFLLAILFIYLVLAAQFESFSDPLIILLAVPFSMTGGVLFLIVFNSSLNLYSNIGLITLVGLITKNSIMIVEFANQLKNSGMQKFEAIVKASKLRLRPILMTSFATILGAFPLVIASGASAASRSSIGLVIFGGMIIGTIFTLFIIPSIYYKFKK